MIKQLKFIFIILLIFIFTSCAANNQSNNNANNIPYTDGENFLEKNYVVEGNDIYRLLGNDRVLTLKTYFDDFENYNTFSDLIKESVDDDLSIWNEVVIQSVEDDTPQKYIARRNCVLDGSCDFSTSKVYSTDKFAYNKNNALYTESDITTKKLVNKASLSSELFYYEKGEEVFIEGWFYIEKGIPLTIIDLQSNWVEKSPGIRVVLTKDGEIYVDLKSPENTQYRQTGEKVYFPIGEWVNVKAYYLLDENNGKIKLWMNDDLLIDTTGKTLIFDNLIYNVFEIGITANHDVETIMYVDDIKISNNDFFNLN